MPTSSPQFAGFSDGTLRFLVELDKNNRREWFNERKAFYKETVEEELRRLVWSTSAALAKTKIPLSTEPQRAIFRIYRDTRFSADKRPYKTNLGSSLQYGRKARFGSVVRSCGAESLVRSAWLLSTRPAGVDPHPRSNCRPLERV